MTAYQRLPCKGSCQRPKPLTEGFYAASAIFHRVIARSCQSSDVAIRFPWQKAVMFQRTSGAAGQQSLPCVKGGGVRKDTGGIDATQLDKLCKIRLLRTPFAASQRETPSGGILFLFVKKEYGERHAKERFVLWNFR